MLITRDGLLAWARSVPLCREIVALERRSRCCIEFARSPSRRPFSGFKTYVRRQQQRLTCSQQKNLRSVMMSSSKLIAALLIAERIIGILLNYTTDAERLVKHSNMYASTFVALYFPAVRAAPVLAISAPDI